MTWIMLLSIAATALTGWLVALWVSRRRELATGRCLARAA